MSFPFDAGQGLVIIRAELWGPSGSAVLRLALDSGATRTVINVALLVALGYDPALARDRVQVTTGSGVEFTPQVLLEKIAALGKIRTDFPVLTHTLPPSAGERRSGWTIGAGFLARTPIIDRFPGGPNQTRLTAGSQRHRQFRPQDGSGM